jgi:transcriptional regulator NrdR family protein
VRTVAKKYGQKSLRSIASAKASRLLIKLFENEEDGELLRFAAVIEQYHAIDERLRRMAKSLRQELEFH